MAASIHGSDPSTEAVATDPEKGEKVNTEAHLMTDVEILEGDSELLKSPTFDKIWTFLLSSGVELRGVQPVPEELRTDSAFNKIFTVWCTSLLCPLPYAISLPVQTS